MNPRNENKSIRARAPKAKTKRIRILMQRIPGKNTFPEITLRKKLFKAGFRYRVNYKPIDTYKIKGDIVFPKKKICIFVDGCFWHGCPIHFKIPKSNSDWWSEKINDNVLRDKKQTKKLKSHGWKVLRFWEHELDPLQINRVLLKISKLFNLPA